MFEHKKNPMLPAHRFRSRMLVCLAIAALIVGNGAGVGMVGYHYLAGFTWIDSFLNACMLLGGMGPVGELPNDASKLFASFYALFSGLIFISVVALLIAPLAHRMLHHFHLAEEDVEN